MRIKRSLISKHCQLIKKNLNRKICWKYVFRVAKCAEVFFHLWFITWPFMELYFKYLIRNALECNLKITTSFDIHFWYEWKKIHDRLHADKKKTGKICYIMLRHVTASQLKLSMHEQNSNQEKQVYLVSFEESWALRKIHYCSSQ